MQRYQLRYSAGQGDMIAVQSLDVPDIVTALVVADIVASGGTLEIRDGEALVAKVEKHASAAGAAFWRVG